MKMQQRLGVVSAVLTFALVAAVTPAQAYQSQSQSATSESSSSVTCEGNGCTGKTESSASVRMYQRQSQGSGSSDSSDWYPSHRRGNYNNSWGDTSGEVRISWDHRGGTCHVRYTEAGSKYFKYATSAACDEGGVTIGGLKTGKNYRFQVRKDSGAWSRSMTVRAE